MFILVTGASGFLGSHVVKQLLEAGHKVRGTARASKAEHVRSAYKAYGDRFEVTVVEDFSNSDLSDAFKGVDALAHVASPLSQMFELSAEEVLKGAIDGTIRVLDSASKAGVKKIVVTSSTSTLSHPNDVWISRFYGDQDWNPLTYEDATKPGANPMHVYAVSKKVAEEAVRKFAKEHPDVDIATVHPALIIGPTGPSQVLPTGQAADGSNTAIYMLLQGSRQPLPEPKSLMFPPVFINVEDTARAHVLLLTGTSSTPSLPAGQVKRVVLYDGLMKWHEAVRYLEETRPAIRERLFVVPEGYEGDEGCARSDGTSSERWVGMKKEDYKGWKETLDATVDCILKRESELGGEK
ncbi:NAD-P-binding protein [Stereum hirsutum FP-91666 SS1]|uniref:NAD-P-binding protein n=1 Tax=Stereum hirsutum (strain FP-91666) TaxID=721885 RepID=UPI0004449F2B|nr:NAD-P-binding protein [Stereum hirsutum FP-91666 SS1]EIM84921.1 NAD-P-binding protein [Stereum hirsutum FP-91666 SS1]